MKTDADWEREREEYRKTVTKRLADVRDKAVGLTDLLARTADPEQRRIVQQHLDIKLQELETLERNLASVSPPEKEQGVIFVAPKDAPNWIPRPVEPKDFGIPEE